MLRQSVRGLVRQVAALSSSWKVPAGPTMAPKKTPKTPPAADSKQRNIVSFFGAPPGGTRPSAVAKAKSDAEPAAAKTQKKAVQSSAADEPAEKRPTKRLRKSAEAEAPQAEAAMPVDLVDDDEQPEALQNGHEEPSATPAAVPAINGSQPHSPVSKGKSHAGSEAGASPAATASVKHKPPPLQPQQGKGSAASQSASSTPHVPLKVLVDAFDEVMATTKRLQKEDALKRCLRQIMDVNGEDLLPTIYMITNRLAPAHEAIELGIGESAIEKALSKMSGQSVKAIKERVKELGDLGDVAIRERKSQKSLGFAAKKAPLTIYGVNQKFWDIARTQGEKSGDRKQGMIQALIVDSQSGTNEAGVIVRALLGKTRIGSAEQTLLVALAQACMEKRAGGKAVPKDAMTQAIATIKQAYSQCPVYDLLVPACLEVAAGNIPVQDILKTVAFKPGLPVKSMLAESTNSISDVIDKYQEQPFTVEYKYDGERAQIHVDENGKVHVFSRNSENMQGKYPDIIARVPACLQDDVKTLVIDCEAVAWDKETKKVLPFQQGSTRKRKDANIADIKVAVHLFAFDCLYYNGRSLLSEPLEERRSILHSALKETDDELSFAVSKTSTDVEELALFLNEAVAAGTEGLIVKSLDSTYEPSKRSLNWLKLKKDYLAGMGDSFDLVPIGAWHGRGKRQGVYGAFLLAVYNDDDETFQTISKIGTGFTDERLKDLHEQMKDHVIANPLSYYSYSNAPKEMPQVWFEPKTVWEVKAADLSISPVHKAATGLVDGKKGISIRFPRLVKVRDDKTPEQATGPQQVADMYRRQASQPKSKGGAGAAAADDDD